MINNILFDIDDTLFPSSEFAALARRNAVRAMIRVGFDAGEEELLRELHKIIEEKGSNYDIHFDLLLKRLDTRNPAKFIAAAVGAYHDTKASIQPFPDVPTVLLELREVGYKIYVASNGIAVKQWDKLIRLGVSQYFDGVFVSEELKSGKSPEFYKKILKKIKAKGNGCVMIGDREDADILPAKKAGMHAIRVLRGKYSKTQRTSRADAKIKDFRKLPPTVLKLSR